MDRSGLALARQVNLSLPVDELDKVLRTRNAPAALLYLALQRSGGKLPSAEQLRLSERDYRTAVEILRSTGVLKSADKPVPDTNTLPEYSSEDIAARVQEDRGFSGVVQLAKQLYNRKLTVHEMQKLLGMQDHLGLPPEVLMQLLTYVFDEYRARNGQGSAPTIRYIERIACRWADDEVLTLDMAERYIKQERERRSELGQLCRLLQMHDHTPTKTERGYLESWIEMKLDHAVIYEAYDRTVTNTGKRSWSYMDKILKKWNEQGLTSLEAVNEQDPRGAQRRPQKTGADTDARNDLARAQALLRGMKNRKEG